MDLAIWTINLASIGLLRDPTHLSTNINFIVSEHIEPCRMDPALCAILEKIRFKPNMNVEVLGQWCNGENAAVARVIEHRSGIVVSYEEPKSNDWDACEHYPNYFLSQAVETTIKNAGVAMTRRADQRLHHSYRRMKRL